MRLGTKKYISAPKRSKKAAGVILTLMVMLSGIVFSLVYILYIIQPTVTNLAKARAKEIGIMTLNKVIAEKIEKENIKAEDLIEYTYDANGKISSLSSNVLSATKLKSELAMEVTDAIRSISKSEIGLTLGTLSGVDILYGTGPTVPVEIQPYGYAQTDIKTKFHEEGINQTAFEVVAEITSDVFILMPTIRQSERITTSVPIVSAVIVGDVPSSYTNVDRDGEEYEDDVLQLAE